MDRPSVKLLLWFSEHLNMRRVEGEHVSFCRDIYSIDDTITLQFPRANVVFADLCIGELLPVLAKADG